MPGQSNSVDRPPPGPDAPEGDDGRRCPWTPRHLPVVVFTRRWRDRFRVRFLLRCWACELERGPFETWAMANAERQDIEAVE